MSLNDRKFGLLTVRYAVDENDKPIRWSPYADRFYCDCKCGNELVVWRSSLVRNVQRDCGMCRRRNKAGRFHRASHQSHHVRYSTATATKKRRTWTSGEYNSYTSMISRCYTSTHHAYADYGGRGIRVCSRWREPKGQGFLNFLEDMGPRPVGKTLDRINPQGHYEATNCRWADAKAQASNQRHIIFRDVTPPPVEKVREMEARMSEFEAELNPF